MEFALIIWFISSLSNIACFLGWYDWLKLDALMAEEQGV